MSHCLEISRKMHHCQQLDRIRTYVRVDEDKQL
jgi:hypothetical protein